MNSLFFFFSAPAAPQLYIDPNTGGMLFQILAVFFALFSGFLFFFSRQIKSASARLRRSFRKEKPVEEETSSANENKNLEQ